jgi:hypothetical protein
MKKLLIPLLFFYTVTNAQSWTDTITMIDKILNRYGTETPGAQLAISRNGEIIFLQHVEWQTLNIMYR